MIDREITRLEPDQHTGADQKRAYGGQGQDPAKAPRSWLHLRSLIVRKRETAFYHRHAPSYHGPQTKYEETTRSIAMIRPRRGVDRNQGGTWWPGIRRRARPTGGGCHRGDAAGQWNG